MGVFDRKRGSNAENRDGYISGWFECWRAPAALAPHAGLRRTLINELHTSVVAYEDEGVAAALGAVTIDACVFV